METKDGTLKDEEAIGQHATAYYRDLFRHEERGDTRLWRDCWDDDRKLNEEDNFHLMKYFTIEEIKQAVWDMEIDVPPGPDGMPAIFYKEFWDVIKDDLKEMFDEFYTGNLNIAQLNLAFITLIPEVESATCIEQYLPFCLSNVSYKIFTQVLANRLSKVVVKIVDKGQNALIPGRDILDRVVVLHEVLHEMKKNDMPGTGILLKFDFDRPYDNVHWDFLEEVLVLKGFANKWIQWMKKALQLGYVSVEWETRSLFWDSQRSSPRGSAFTPPVQFGS